MERMKKIMKWRTHAMDQINPINNNNKVKNNNKIIIRWRKEDDKG